MALSIAIAALIGSVALVTALLPITAHRALAIVSSSLIATVPTVRRLLWLIPLLTLILLSLLLGHGVSFAGCPPKRV